MRSGENFDQDPVEVKRELNTRGRKKQEGVKTGTSEKQAKKAAARQFELVALPINLLYSRQERLRYLGWLDAGAL